MERAIEQSLRALSQLATSPLLERMGLTESVEKLVARGTRAGLRAASQVAKQAAPVIKLLQPLRMHTDPSQTPDLFDLTPTDSQELVRDSMARARTSCSAKHCKAKNHPQALANIPNRNGSAWCSTT